MDDNNEPIVKLSILPTKFRTNWIYIRVYILWMNMIVMILIPFVLLLYLNIQVRMLEIVIILQQNSFLSQTTSDPIFK